MSLDAESLYKLLPAIHRNRDAEQGYPLRQLIDVIASQAAVLEENLAQLYDNQFVETAAPWALPYIADLLGLRGLSGRQALTLNPRAEIAHTIAYRRRKGTTAMLEQLARDVTGWPALAVEFFDRLAATQSCNHLRPQCRAFANLRDTAALEFFNTPFEQAARTVEVRRIPPRRGKWNIPNIGIFLWRLRAYSITRSPLAPAFLFSAASGNQEPSKRHFRFHPLGLDAPLFSLPETEDEITHVAEPVNVPLPITKRLLRGESVDSSAFPDHRLCFHPSMNYYASGKSISLEYPPAAPGAEPTEVVLEQVIICDLADLHEDTNDLTKITGWSHDNAKDGLVLLDPQRGRVVFPQDQDDPPLASFHFGFSANLGGGEYDRVNSFMTRAPRLFARVPELAGSQNSYTTIDDAFNAVLPMLPSAESKSALVEIMDSGLYELKYKRLDVVDGQLEVRAADGRRPLILLSPPNPSASPSVLVIAGAEAGSVVMNGFLLAGAQMEINGKLGHFRLRHCALASHLVINNDGTLAKGSAEPCVIVASSGTQVEFQNCVLGPVKVTGHDVILHFRNCIIDARDSANFALKDDYANSGPSRWTLENCTVIGTVDVGVLELASNTIFLGDSVNVQRRQEGCVRFCWLPPGARVPRRHQCLPTDAAPDVQPAFTSLQFGDPAYGQLSQLCPEAIRTGADDGSEMGVFHDLFQPQREAYLRGRLEEYLRIGLEAGIFYAS